MLSIYHIKNKLDLAIIILLIGVVIRGFYLEKFGVMLFQHDWHGHIEFIKYLAQHWSLPLADKGLEYPQQPLYYLIAAAVYTVTLELGLGEQMALDTIGFLSFVCSVLFLVYAYRFTGLVSESQRVRTIAMIFLALTPSIVYMSARINNDALVMALSSISLFYIVKSYQSDFKEAFYPALLFVSLLFMTKISAASIELLFFVLLLIAYAQTDKQRRARISKRLYLFGMVGVFLLGFTLLRVYMPIEESFHMVNSSAHYPNQMIETLDAKYFGTFHFIDLFRQGYSDVYGEDSIRYSFMTYQYGTMLFGEFDYTYFIQRHILLAPLTKALIVLGTMYVLGFIIYVLHLYHQPRLHQLLFATVLMNLLLVLKFVFTYPVVCNTDFRYFVSSFVLIAFLVSKGIDILTQYRWQRVMVSIMMTLYTMVTMVYFILLC